MPRHHRLKDPVVQQSDLEGTGIYPVNTRPGKDPGAPPIPVYLNSEKLKRGLRPLEGKGCSFGPWAATVSGLVSSTNGTDPERSLPQASMVLTVPSQLDQPPACVAVEVVLSSPGSRSSSPAHHGYVAPARSAPTQDSSGRWCAIVEVDARSRPDDLQSMVGRKLTEISSLVRDNPGGVPSAGFGDQTSAGVMHDRSACGAPTAYDRATAHEVVDLAKDFDRLQRTRDVSQGRLDLRARTLDDAINAAGLNLGHNFEAKLCLLREAGATQDLITRVQLGEASRLLYSTLGANSYLTPESAQHLLWPAEPTGGFRNGVSGGHFTSWLLAMAGPHTPYAFLEVCVLEFAGTTLRLFTQFKWKGDGDKPMPGSGRAPGEPQCNPKDWIQADSPKTTFDDKAALLRESNAAVLAFVAQHGNAVPLDRWFTITTASGIRMQGYFEPDLGPDGRIILRTAYVDATWLSERIVERALVRSDDLVARPTSLGERESLWLKLVRAFRLLLRVAELCRDLWVVGDLA